MPHELIEETRGFYRKFTGDITVSEILDSNISLFDNHNNEKIHYVINDFTDVSDILLEINDTQMIADIDQIYSCARGEMKIAFITGNNNKFIEIADDYCEKMKHCHYQCMKFQSLDEARIWATAD